MDNFKQELRALIDRHVTGNNPVKDYINVGIDLRIEGEQLWEAVEEFLFEATSDFSKADIVI